MMRSQTPGTGYLMLLLYALAVVAAGSLSACAPHVAEDDGRLQVVVSIVPQRYFVERIGGEFVRVNVMVGPGDEPHTYEPKPDQMRALSNADVYFSTGVDFENSWLDKIAATNPDMLMVDTVAGIERMPMAVQDDHEEAGAPDPHVWLSPELVKVQSQVIYEALVQLDPAHADAYTANLAAFVADIDALETEIRDALAGVTNRKFMVFHPSWGYFARDFGLEQIPVEVGGQEPSAQELAALIARAKDEGIHVVFAQPEFSTQDAETIAEAIDGEVLLVSPLARDWLENLRTVSRTFANAMESE